MFSHSGSQPSVHICQLQKDTAMPKSKPTDEVDDSMRVLASGTCNTLSESSRLTYPIGSLSNGEIYLRVQLRRSLLLAAVDLAAGHPQVLKNRPHGKSITSIFLNPLFRGKSVNMSAFLLAVLLQEKVLHPAVPDDPVHADVRCHRCRDHAVFHPYLTLTLLRAIVLGGGFSSTSTAGGNRISEDYILDALDLVSAWIIPDDDFADAVNAQARLMAGVNPEEFWGGHAITL
jgi:hypothetical protein